MTQTELIKRVKVAHKQYFNPNAFFLVTEPFHKRQELGLKKSELEKGIYVSLLTKEKTEMYPDTVFYFKFDAISPLWDKFTSTYNKFMFSLNNISSYGQVIMLEKKEQAFVTQEVHATPQIKEEVTEFTESKPEAKTVNKVKITTKILKAEYKGDNTTIVLEHDDKGFTLDISSKKPSLSLEEFTELCDILLDIKRDILEGEFDPIVL